jgi:hypothetical protein
MNYESDEFNYICGQVVTNKIVKLIKNMKYKYDHYYDESDSVDLERIDTCIKLLRTTDNDTFYSIYVGIPTDYYDYFDDELDDEINDESMNDDESTNDVDIKHSYLEYALAILSDTSLIKRGLEISKAPLNKALNIISEYDDSYMNEIPKNFCIESYTLLYSHGFNVTNLYRIAQCRHDYAAIKFIISVMTEHDLDNAMHYDQHRIIDILLIDRCKQIGTRYILSLLYNHIINSPNNLSIAYFIINIVMNHENGLNYIKELKKSASDINDINTLLAYHRCT